jgi:hypothetical protein
LFDLFWFTILNGLKVNLNIKSFITFSKRRKLPFFKHLLYLSTQSFLHHVLLLFSDFFVFPLSFTITFFILLNNYFTNISWEFFNSFYNKQISLLSANWNELMRYLMCPSQILKDIVNDLFYFLVTIFCCWGHSKINLHDQLISNWNFYQLVWSKWHPYVIF